MGTLAYFLIGVAVGAVGIICWAWTYDEILDEERNA